MTTFPGSPRLQKGAIVGFDPLNPLASVVVFQYNPQDIRRTLAPTGPTGTGARTEVMRLAGPPRETLTVKVRLNATDQLEKSDPIAQSMGIYPQLSALEMLIYPKSAVTIANTVLLALGTIEIVPPEAPFTLLVWGVKRVVPVRITTMSITEQQWDPGLNPIQAEVDLGLEILSTNDYPITHPGSALFLAHQVVKEVMAVVGSVSNLSAVASGGVKIL